MKTERNTVLITGATSGIGLEIANVFAEKKYNLFLVSRNQDNLNNIKMKLENLYGVDVKIMSIDLAMPLSARKLFDETLHQKIEIDILVNNAGFGLHGEHTDLDMRKVGEMIQLNVITLTELCALFGNEMKKKRKGYILNIASSAAYQPTPYIAVYGATKSYVLNFSEALAKELEDFNVVVTCLSPGATDTNFLNVAGLGNAKGIWAKSALMKPREVAEIGVNAMFAKKLSLIAGILNSFLAFTNRLAPRTICAIISKKIIKQATS